jgi:hypothetical protein
METVTAEQMNEPVADGSICPRGDRDSHGIPEGPRVPPLHVAQAKSVTTVRREIRLARRAGHDHITFDSTERSPVLQRDVLGMLLGQGRAAEIVHQQGMTLGETGSLQIGEWPIGDECRVGVSQGFGESASSPQIPTRQTGLDMRNYWQQVRPSHGGPPPAGSPQYRGF